MTRRWHEVLAGLVLLAWIPAHTQACELVLTEHRTGKLLKRLALTPGQLAFDIDFTHSVLGTPVTDRYVWRNTPEGGRAYLVEEWFDGDGYGLPHTAIAGETLRRVATASGERWRLQTNRPVDPLVVLSLLSQRMRVTVQGQRPVVLGELTTKAVLLKVQNCQ